MILLLLAAVVFARLSIVIICFGARWAYYGKVLVSAA